jgi:hypothetical protein
MPVAFTVSADAAAPPTDLRVDVALREAGTEEPVPSATYDITVTNVGEEEITSLRLLDRLLPGLRVEGTEPPGEVDAALGQVQWGLDAFGRTSLAPGESLAATLTVAQDSPTGCASTGDGLMAFAAPAGGETETYAALDDEFVLVGECLLPAIGGGGAIPTDVRELPRGGTGGYLDDPGRKPWVLPTILAGLSALLFATAFLCRARGAGRRGL